MSTRSMMDVTEIVNELGVSKAFAYNLIKKFNNELKQKGFTTITGKVSRKYFEEQFYNTLKGTLNHLFLIVFDW